MNTREIDVVIKNTKSDAELAAIVEEVRDRIDNLLAFYGCTITGCGSILHVMARQGLIWHDVDLDSIHYAEQKAELMNCPF